jgi:RNA-binding protein
MTQDRQLALNAPLEGHQRKYLRGLAHSMRPVLQVGQHGVTDAVIRETCRALRDHELIKVGMKNPVDKKAMAAKLAVDTDAHLAGLVGHVVVLYREHDEKPKIRLPKSKA